MKLNAKLIMMMLSLLVLAILVLFVLNQFSQNDLVREIQESSNEVSKAIQLSVEDLTSESDVENSRLKEYLQQARKKGINEINIIDSDGEIINSSDPALVGKKRDMKKMGTGLKAVRGGRQTSVGSLKPYELVVPVIVGDEQLGYVQVNLLLDNIREIQHDNFIRRLLATSLLFMIGIMLTFFLAQRYTRPIRRLVEGVKRVSGGDLTVNMPVETHDEIGELAESFNEMVEQLREREHLEKRLYEAEHLSKVGQLASGIAHEIRNPLNYISLAVDHLRSEMLPICGERSEELLELTGKIKEEVRRANYMVLNFMNYGRPLKLRPAMVDYRSFITRLLPLVQEKLTEQHVTIIMEIPEDLPPVEIDQELMRNCLVNFITNAAQSMAEGGTVTLGAVYDHDSESFHLTVADEGGGIAPEDLEKIFQPYFTTKEAGIGLGLAITERIVKEHRGTIRVTSEPGRGTLFTIVLPRNLQRGEA
jgi:nitrogen fixation/metabolism regulation signal transduction histidine kinase